MDVSADATVTLKGGTQKISPYVARTPIALSERMGASFQCQHGVLQSSYNGDMMYQPDDGPCTGSVKVLNMYGTSTYMMNTLLKRVVYLEERILALEKMIGSQIHPKKVRAIASACQDLAVFCGRVCCDTEGGRLNPQSLILEGSIASSRGARVKLDVQACGSYRLFPGQIIAVVGKNPTGFCIVAQDIIHTFPFSDDGKEEFEDTYSFNMVIASGPYTTTDNLAYEPLRAIIEYCEKEKPDALMLLGPFVDQEHPSISKGTIDATFEDIFEIKVLEEIKLLEETTKILMMPSIRDVHHDVAFPQNPFCVSDDARVESLPNPATMNYAGTLLSCSSVDWLMSCTKEEISKSAAPADRLSTLATHIVQQKSFYPMYPPPANLPLDVSSPDALDIVSIPDILVTPSDLAPFAKSTSVDSPIVDIESEQNHVTSKVSRDIVCINPGRITKGTTAGTFAHVYINKKESSQAPITSRCKVEIKKL